MKESISLCDNFEFVCPTCQVRFKLTWYEIKGLLNPYHSVVCIHCQTSLALPNKERRLLARYLTRAAKLAKLLFFFVIPYFLLSIVFIWRFGGIISSLFIVFGFIIFILLKVLINKPVKDFFELEPIRDNPLSGEL
ncbi:hypothetical protein MTZ49_06370 [Entomomonas sp. E2T0]|uniref:hypothetical protein n=1 Tax=Entomomonas sp. E2T0 TaxID=2930213 RepID=UPI002228171A|nr:hypothetical protein [Entomomonas sp. E2T0]UYZ85174.1 hypothetical protein MTZ49_06370 [Entomomonas sp. E2T0]